MAANTYHRSSGYLPESIHVPSVQIFHCIVCHHGHVVYAGPRIIYGNPNTEGIIDADRDDRRSSYHFFRNPRGKVEDLTCLQKVVLLGKYIQMIEGTMDDAGFAGK
jgi:hypothetical protein